MLFVLLLKWTEQGIKNAKQTVDRAAAARQMFEKAKARITSCVWTLMPGFGDNSEQPFEHDESFIHPFRVSNAYSLLADLGQVRGIEVTDGSEVRTDLAAAPPSS